MYVCEGVNRVWMVLLSSYLCGVSITRGEDEERERKGKGQGRKGSYF